MPTYLLLLLLLQQCYTCLGETEEIHTTVAAPLSIAEDNDTAPAPGQGGRSFFLFGGFFRKFRQRWRGQNDPVPLYAGPAFPLAGYYNCPIYGCDPALTYRPAPYEPPNYYNRPPYRYNPNPPYALPQALPNTQSQQQQSNVVIYQNGQQQQRGPSGYYPPNYSLLPAAQAPVQNSYPVNPQYYQHAGPPPLPPPPPPLPAPINYPQNDGNSGVYQNFPQYQSSGYGGYPPAVAAPVLPPMPSDYDQRYAQSYIPPSGHGNTGINGPPPPCPPHVYPCQVGK